jgi:hypothetical protein
MFEQRRPKVGDQVIYWTPADKEGDPCVPNLALVCNVAREGEIEWRPLLNLTVFRAHDAKAWPRLEVPCVYDDGGVPHLAHRYSFEGEYNG